MEPFDCVLFRKFFELLPAALQKHDIQILDGEGKVKVGDEHHPWKAVVKRAPNYFDIMLAGKGPKEYSSTVFTTLHNLYPKAGRKDMRSTVLQFVKRLDHVAMPIILL